jgi:hypothetical protein
VDRVPQGQRHLQHLTPQKTAQADPSKQPNIESDRTDWEVSDTYTTDGDVLKMQLDSIGETWGFRWSLHRGRSSSSGTRHSTRHPSWPPRRRYRSILGNGSASGTPPDAYGGEAPASPPSIAGLWCLEASESLDEIPPRPLPRGGRCQLSRDSLPCRTRDRPQTQH